MVTQPPPTRSLSFNFQTSTKSETHNHQPKFPLLWILSVIDQNEIKNLAYSPLFHHPFLHFHNNYLMETFAASSSARLFVENHSHNRLQSHSISFLCCHSPTPTPREAAAAFLLCRPTDTPFIGKNLNNHHHHPLNRSVSSLSLPLLPRRTIVPVSLATALTASEAETEAQVLFFIIFLFKIFIFPLLYNIYIFLQSSFYAYNP